jgi:hypothetical protein
LIREAAAILNTAVELNPKVEDNEGMVTLDTL